MDDDPSIREISKLMLMDLESRFDIDNACCVSEAFKKLSTRQYDVIVSDYEMPKENGLEFLKELREQKNDVAFIIFTGRGREEVAVEALNLGADRYLNKNGSPEAVYSELAYAIKDIAERKKSKQLLRVSESKYRLLVENSLQGIMIAQNLPLRVVFANIAIGKMLGYKPEEFTSLSPSEIVALIYHEDKDLFFNRFKNRLEGKEADNSYEFRAVRKDGSILWMEAFANKIEYDGQPAVQAMFLDIDERKKSEAAIKKSETRYKELANFLPEIVFETDLSGKISFFSQRAFEITGFTPKELEKGMNMLQFVVPEDLERAKENIKKRMTGEKTVSSEFTLFRKNGDTYPAIVKTAPIYSENKLIGLRGLVIDISERKKTKEETGFLASLVQNSNDAIIGKSLDGSITSWNNAAEYVYGYNASEVIGKSIQILAPTEEREEIDGILRRIGTGEQIKQYQATRVRKDGSKIDVSLTISPIRNSEGTIIGASTIARDITEQKKAQQSLLESEEKFRILSEESPNMIFMNQMGKVIFVNKKLEEATGYTREELCASDFDFFTLFSPEYIETLKLNHAKQMRGENPSPFEQVLVTRAGKRINVIISTKLTEYKGKQTLLGILTDITEHIEFEKKIKESHLDLEIVNKKLRESQEKYEATFESSMDALMLLDEKGFLDCNKATLGLFGCNSVKEFIKFHPADLSPPTQPDSTPSMNAAMSHIQKAFQTGMEHFLWTHKRTDDTTFQADVLLTKMPLNGREILQATVRDITQQKEAEEQLKQAEEKYEALLNAANVLVQSVDADGRYSFVNEEWKKVLGYSEADLKNITIMNVVQKDHLQYCMRVFKEVMYGTCVREVETIFVAKDGNEIVVSGNACPIFKDGKFVSTVAFFVDITNRKKNEAQLKENSRRIEMMNEKLRVVGGLTRHDVRNKLSAVTGYSYILKKKHSDLIDVVEGLSKMEQAVVETVKIFDFAKMYEQIGAEELSYVNVEEKLNEAVTLFSGAIPLIKNECSGLTVLADSFLRQLFYNFIDNTRKYGQKTTTIRVYFDKADKDSLKLVYEDDGVGISLENKKSLFKEGFSTGQSTGFGLFLSKKMIDVYGWTITEEGEPGKGVKFIIKVPLTSFKREDQ